MVATQGIIPVFPDGNFSPPRVIKHRNKDSDVQDLTGHEPSQPDHLGPTVLGEPGLDQTNSLQPQFVCNFLIAPRDDARPAQPEGLKALRWHQSVAVKEGINCKGGLLKSGEEDAGWGVSPECVPGP